MSADKIERALEEAYKKALVLVRNSVSPDVHENSIAVAAAQLAHVLIEIDLDED